MPAATVPVLTLIDQDRDPTGFAAALGAAFERFGFAIVADHGIPPALIEHAWSLTAALFRLPEAEKRACFDPGGGGQRGFTPYRTEIARDGRHVDLKEFWHIGRERFADPVQAAHAQPNLWPERPDGFRATMLELWNAFEAVGARLLSAIARHLQLPADALAPAIADGNSILRLLHYPPVTDAGEGERAAAHEDIDLITLLLGAEEAGLELLDRDGRWLPVRPPDGALVVNVGDMLQRLTNRMLPSTTHRVVNPPPERRGRSRYAMPFFLHPRPDYVIAPLPGCVSQDRPNRYPEPITADAFLRQRLVEIGLVKASPLPPARASG